MPGTLQSSLTWLQTVPPTPDREVMRARLQLVHLFNEARLRKGEVTMGNEDQARQAPATRDLRDLLGDIDPATVRSVRLRGQPEWLLVENLQVPEDARVVSWSNATGTTYRVLATEITGIAQGGA